MKPIEKNFIVIDNQGMEAGVTYPKRAKGLVKNGWAEYVDDRTIRLLHTSVSSVDTFLNDITEDINMSKIINFNARDFQIDCNDSNACERMFFTQQLL